MKYLLGIDIGGTKCAVILADENLKIIDRIQIPTVDRQTTITQLFASADSLINQHNIANTAVIGIGVSCGGPLDSVNGIIQSPPNLPGWDDVPITHLFSERYGIQTYLENDANACAVAEWRYGSGKGIQNMIFLTFGTGLGAGLILNGALYRGASSMAGEVGHIRLTEDGPDGYGKVGSAEGYCSGGGIAKLAQIKLKQYQQLGKNTGVLGELDLNTMTARDVALAAESGDALALEILSISGYHLGMTLAILIDLFNPERVVIGSIYLRCERFLSSAMQRVIQKEALPISYHACEILAASLGESIGDYAALAIADGITA